MKKIILSAVLMIATSSQAELVHQFKDPAFSGAGWSSHVLTIESVEKSRRDAIESQRKSDLAAAAAINENAPLNRFMSLFQSQVYAQLSTQLTNNLFQNKCVTSSGATIPGCVNPTTGSFVLDNNTVTWEKSTSAVKLTVVDSAGTITTVNVPIASFAF